MKLQSVEFAKPVRLPTARPTALERQSHAEDDRYDIELRDQIVWIAHEDTRIGIPIANVVSMRTSERPRRRKPAAPLKELRFTGDAS